MHEDDSWWSVRGSFSWLVKLECKRNRRDRGIASSLRYAHTMENVCMQAASAAHSGNGVLGLGKRLLEVDLHFVYIYRRKPAYCKLCRRYIVIVPIVYFTLFLKHQAKEHKLAFDL